MCLITTERDGEQFRSTSTSLGRPDTYFSHARCGVHAAGEIRVLDDSRPRIYVLLLAVTTNLRTVEILARPTYTEPDRDVVDL
jgi:hypothetical protein